MLCSQNVITHCIMPNNCITLCACGFHTLCADYYYALIIIDDHIMSCHMPLFAKTDKHSFCYSPFDR